MFNSNTPFTMPVTPANSGGFGFGGNGFDSIIALAIIGLIFGGWGNGWGGYGMGGGQSTSVYEGYVLNNDFSQLSRQIDNGFSEQRGQGIQIANGISSLGYEQLGQMNNINTNISATGNAIQSQLADCCCKTQTAIGDVKYAIGQTGSDLNYNIATQANGITNAVNTGFCQTNFNNSNNTRDIIDATNAGFQRLDAKIDAIVNSQKDAKIAEQSCIINNQYLLSQIKQAPVPAYIVQNPNCGCGYGQAFGTTIA